jgi:DNA-binding NtrC family response regulator
VFSIFLPPLKERKEDIPLIVERFLMDSPNKLGVNSSALQFLIGYSWPGNIRELQNTIERAAVMSETGEIETRHLPENITRGYSGSGIVSSREEGDNSVSIDDQIKEIEKGIIIEALRKTNGVQIKAAEILGINQRSLWHRVKKYEIDVKEIKNSN